MKRIVLIVRTPIEVVVDDDHWAIIVAQRTPADIVMPAIPVDPSWPPVPCGYPIPT
jgi:hypothetical protein